MTSNENNVGRRTLLTSCGSVVVSLGLTGCADRLTQKNEPLPIYAENEDTVDHSATIIASASPSKKLIEERVTIPDERQKIAEITNRASVVSAELETGYSTQAGPFTKTAASLEITVLSADEVEMVALRPD